ncbi:hypothetical protein LXL04_001717 [Taraxacum kok-saghyz]
MAALLCVTRVKANHGALWCTFRFYHQWRIHYVARGIFKKSCKKIFKDSDRDLCGRIPQSSDLRSIASQRMTAPATISPRSSSSKLSSPSISLPSTKSVLELGFGSLCRWSKLKGLGFQFVLKSTNLSSNRREIEGSANLSFNRREIEGAAGTWFLTYENVTSIYF